MSGIDVRVVPALMEAMSKAFSKAQQDVTDIMVKMDETAEKMEGGVLLGDGGAAFADAIRTVLYNDKLAKLGAKLTELNSDVTKALKDHQEAEAKAAKLFSS